MYLNCDEKSIHDITRLGRLSPYIHIILAGIVASLIYNYVPKSQLITWIGIMVGISLLRLALEWANKKKKISLIRYFYFFSYVAIFHALLWGMSLVFFSRHIPSQHEVFLILVVAGTGAAAVPLLSPVSRLYITYCTSLMGPIIIFQLFKNDQFSFTVAISCMIYLVAMILASITVNKNFQKLRETRLSLDRQIAFVNGIYNSALDISFISCDMSEDNYNILSFSSGSESIFGYRKEEALGKPLNYIFNKEAYNSCKRMLKKIKAGSPVKQEIELVKNIGVIHNLNMSVYPLYSDKCEINAALIVSMDISESRHTEEALINSEEKSRNIIDASPMGMQMYHLDPRGRLVFVGANHAADKITGIDNQKLIGLTIEQAFPSLIETDIPDAYRKVAAEGKPWYKDQMQYDDNKTAGIFEIHAFQTSPGKMVAMLLDVANRVGAEMALRKSEERFRDIALSSSDWIWEIDSTGKFTYVSEGVKSVIGYEPEELIGKSMFDIVSQDEVEVLRDLFKMVSSRNRNITDWINWDIHKDGSLICIQTNGVPILNNEGNLRGYRGVNKDITEQKRHEEQLQQSEERYRTLIESMEEGLLIVSLEEIIIFANKAACDIFGLSQDKIIGSNFNEIVANEEVPIVYQNLLRAQNRMYRKKELTVERLDGQRRNILLSATLLKNHDENILGSFGILTDITELKRAEREKLDLREQLTNAQRMESLGILAGGVAHDLNNILGPLVAYPDLIKMKLNDDNPIINDIMKVKKSAERAAEVVQDLLTLARRGRYELAPVDMRILIDSYLKSPEFTVLESQNPNINIITDINDEIPLANGSEPHLMKVIMNLIINAMDTMSSGGDLRISLNYGHVDMLIGGFDNLAAGEYIVLTVSDTGSGIEQSDMKHIFEPFYSKKKMGRSGSGLGLSIVYGIIKDHNGYIDVKSDFVVYLPVVKIEPESQEQIVIDIRGSEKLLVVDDMEEQRELAVTILASLGYQVKAAKNGREAVEYLKNNRADLVILDMIMDDDFDGLLTRKLSKSIPIRKQLSPADSPRPTGSRRPRNSAWPDISGNRIICRFWARPSERFYL
jgi:PAS domain S-box-containing protein